MTTLGFGHQVLNDNRIADQFTLPAALPVVAFEGPGTNDLLKGAHCGALIHQGDIAAFADCLEQYSVDTSLRKQLGECGRKLAAQYDRRIVARRNIDLNESVRTWACPARRWFGQEIRLLLRS